MDEGRPFYPIPFDVVLAYICPHLNVQDLGRLLQCSRACCEFFICDPSWRHIRERCIERVPFWQELVFEPFPWNTENNHATDGRKANIVKDRPRKLPLRLPCGGIWFVLKTYVSKARNENTLRYLRRKLLNGHYMYTASIPIRSPVSRVLQISIDSRQDCLYQGQRKFNFNGHLVRAEPQLAFITERFNYAKCAIFGGVHVLAHPEMAVGVGYFFVTVYNDTVGFKDLFWFQGSP